MVIIDWLDHDIRYTGMHIVQLTVTSANVVDDPTNYKLMSLRNALVSALDAYDLPDAKSIPLYRRSKRGHVVFKDSHKTQFAMVMTPYNSPSEHPTRRATALGTPGDRSSMAQEGSLLASFSFTFRCMMCQNINMQGALR